MLWNEVISPILCGFTHGNQVNLVYFDINNFKIMNTRAEPKGFQTEIKIELDLVQHNTLFIPALKISSVHSNTYIHVPTRSIKQPTWLFKSKYCVYIVPMEPLQFEDYSVECSYDYYLKNPSITVHVDDYLKYSYSSTNSRLREMDMDIANLKTGMIDMPTTLSTIRKYNTKISCKEINEELLPSTYYLINGVWIMYALSNSFIHMFVENEELPIQYQLGMSRYYYSEANLKINTLDCSCSYIRPDTLFNYVDTSLVTIAIELIENEKEVLNHRNQKLIEDAKRNLLMRYKRLNDAASTLYDEPVIQQD